MEYIVEQKDCDRKFRLVNCGVDMAILPYLTLIIRVFLLSCLSHVELKRKATEKNLSSLLLGEKTNINHTWVRTKGWSIIKHQV